MQTSAYSANPALLGPLRAMVRLEPSLVICLLLLANSHFSCKPNVTCARLDLQRYVAVGLEHSIRLSLRASSIYLALVFARSPSGECVHLHHDALGLCKAHSNLLAGSKTQIGSRSRGRWMDLIGAPILMDSSCGTLAPVICCARPPNG